MSFFPKDTHDTWRQKRSQQQLMQGGLPLNAEYRLRRLEAHPRLFTSFQSISSFALGHSIGLVPCGQVTGTSVFHIGMQPTPVYSSSEMLTLSKAQMQGRHRAVQRMLSEAKQLGAHDVIEVRVAENGHHWDKQGVEFTATGTAMRREGQEYAGVPMASTFSGQELLALNHAGYFAVGLAFGACVYYQVGSRYTTELMQGGILNGAARINQEMMEYTWGFIEARRTALKNLEYDTMGHYAVGILGTKITKTMEIREVDIEMMESRLCRRDLLITFNAMGSMVRSVDRELPEIHSSMPLNI